MSSAKMGRPTESPKDTMIRVRMDKETVAVLDDCAQQLNTTRSEVIRKGIRLMHETIKK